MIKNKILIVEDEAIVAKDIQQSLKRLGYDVAGSATTGKKAIELSKEKQPDLILMDIMLKGDMSGIEAATQIKKELKIPIVYLTAYTDENTLNKAKITEPYGYIIKPFKDIDLQTSIEMSIYKASKENEDRKFLEILAQKKDRIIFIKSNSRLVKIKSDTILFVEALKDYVIINTYDSKYTIHSTMKDIEKKLLATEFLRIHRSYIVRIDKIATIEQSNILLEGLDKLFPIGGSYKEELFKRIKMI